MLFGVLADFKSRTSRQSASRCMWDIFGKLGAALHRRCMWDIFGKFITADILYIRCTLLTFSYSFSRTESKIKSHSVFSCLDLEVEDGWKTGIRER